MIIYFDTETSGLRPGRICQLSYILQEKNETRGKNFFFSVGYVEPSAYAVHGFSPERLYVLSGGKVFGDFAEEIKADFKSADLIVAHNFNFDFMFLSAEFENIGDRFEFNQSFCSMKKFTPICKLPRSGGAGYKYPKLTELCSFLDIYAYDVTRATISLFGAAPSAHDARYDTAALYLAMNRGAENFADIRGAMDVCL